MITWVIVLSIASAIFNCIFLCLQVALYFSFRRKEREHSLTVNKFFSDVGSSTENYGYCDDNNKPMIGTHKGSGDMWDKD